MSNYVKKECKRLPGAGARSVAVACEERSSALLKNILQSGERIVRVSQEGNRRKHALKWKNAMHLPPWCV